MEGNALEYKKHIYEFLAQEKVAVLSTVRENGFPDAALIYYYLDAHRNIVFLSRSSSRKMLNLDHQDHIVLTVPRVATKEVVQIRGVAEVMASGAPEVAENLLHLTNMLEHDGEEHAVIPLLKHPEGQVIVVTIRPIELRWRRYSAVGLEEEKISV